MFGKVFEETIEDRALAGIINYITVEIITRRDLIETGNDIFILDALNDAYHKLSMLWHQSYDIAPIAYASAWDEHASSCPDFTVEASTLSREISHLVRVLPEKVHEVFGTSSFAQIQKKEAIQNNMAIA